MIDEQSELTTRMPYPFFCDDDLKNVSEWFGKCLEELNFEFVGENISKFRKQIIEMENSLPLEPNDNIKVESILKLLKEDNVPYAIFVDKEDNFILEGRHRIVAFHKFGLTIIPVYYVSQKEIKTVDKTVESKNIKEKFVVLCEYGEITRFDKEDEASNFCLGQNKHLPTEIMTSLPQYCHYRRLIIDDKGNEKFEPISFQKSKK